MDAYLKEMFRVCKDTGIIIMISHASPERRLLYFQKILPNIPIDVIKIRKFSFFIFFYEF
jgi:ubiquinone/menaquinone biosynthesis C-methylase UbiE